MHVIRPFVSIKVVGLTGGIACGKSTVAGFLEELGVPVVDADEIARAVVEPGCPAHRDLVAAFGPDVLDGEGRMDRRWLADRVFGDPEARGRLEAIVHPRVVEEAERRFAEIEARGESAAVYEAALLVETGRYRGLAGLIVVTCSHEEQRRRIQVRDCLDTKAADARILAQMPVAEKEAVADWVVRTDGDIEDVRARTREVWHVIAERLGVGS